MSGLYGRIVDGVLDGPIRRPRSKGEYKVADGTLVRPGEMGWTPALLDVCGFVEAIEDRPTLGADEVYDTHADLLEAGIPVRRWTKRAKTAEELAAEADEADREAKRTEVGRAVATLRQWAQDARDTTVTATNIVAVTNVVVDRLGVFFDRFADLIEAQRLDG